MPWTGSSRITFQRPEEDNKFAGERVEFTAVEIGKMLEIAYVDATKKLRSMRETVMPDIEMKFQPQLSAHTGANEGHGRAQQPDLPYIKLQMDGLANDKEYLARWYLSAMEASFLDKEVQSRLTDFKAEHSKFGTTSDTEMSYEVVDKDNTTTRRCKTIKIQIRPNNTGACKLLNQADVEQAVKDLIEDITHNIKCGLSTLSTLAIKRVVRKNAADNAKWLEADLKAARLTKNLFEWCNNIANLTPSFLYMYICDRVISVERKGLYVDDLGFLIDVQLQITSMLYNHKMSRIHNRELYLTLMVKACQERNKEVKADSVMKYFDVAVDNGVNKIRLLEDFYDFRRDHFNEGKSYSKARILKSICDNHYLIQQCSDWRERTEEYDAYIKRYYEKHIIRGSGDRGYRKYYESIMRKEGQVPLVKAIYAIHENKLWDKFEKYGWNDSNRYKGPSYPDFAEMMTTCGLSDKDLAGLLRSVLRLRSDIDLGAGLFLPNVAVTMFFAEVARFPRSYISALMMLDLIEDERTNYSWQACFHNMKAWNDGWSTSREDKDVKKERFEARDMFGQRRFYQTVQGMYTMSNLNSTGVSSTKKIWDRPELQKEASIAIDWLAFVFASQHKDYNVTTSITELGKEDKTPPVIAEGTAKAELQQRLIKMLTVRAQSVGDLASLLYE